MICFSFLLICSENSFCIDFSLSLFANSLSLVWSSSSLFCCSWSFSNAKILACWLFNCCSNSILISFSFARFSFSVIALSFFSSFCCSWSFSNAKILACCAFSCFSNSICKVSNLILFACSLFRFWSSISCFCFSCKLSNTNIFSCCSLNCLANSFWRDSILFFVSLSALFWSSSCSFCFIFSCSSKAANFFSWRVSRFSNFSCKLSNFSLLACSALVNSSSYFFFCFSCIDSKPFIFCSSASIWSENWVFNWIISLLSRDISFTVFSSFGFENKLSGSLSRSTNSFLPSSYSIAYISRPSLVYCGSSIPTTTSSPFQGIVVIPPT